MAVKKVNDGITAPVKGAPPSTITLADALARVGLLTGGKDPLKVAAQLLGSLVAKGFGAGVGNVEAALKNSIVAFQRANGLPVTGALDAQTAQAMSNQGLLPGQGVNQFQDGFEKKLKAGPSTDDPTAMKNAGQGGLAERLSSTVGGFLGSLFGTREKPAEQKLDTKGQGGGADTTTTDKKGQAQDGSQTTASGHQASTSSSEKARSDSAGLHDPTGRGVKEGDRDALAGRGAQSGEQGGSSGKGGAKGAKGGAKASGSATDDEGDEDRQGNASSGDEDFDDDEGHASTDDGSRSKRGHWRVPGVDVQAQRILDAIRKEPDVENRAAAYSLDVHFYRPGVYAAGQKGDEILHLVVTGAPASDPVWTTVVERVQKLVDTHAPGRFAPDVDDFKAALRVARYRREE